MLQIDVDMCKCRRLWQFIHFFSRKLLKMHEAKYEPMDKVDEKKKEKEQCLIFLLQVDAEKIMEEILGMKAGLNPDQQVILKLMLASCWHILI